MDLSQLIYMGMEGGSRITYAEMQHFIEVKDEQFYMLDIRKTTKSSLEKTLKTYTGMSLEEMNGIGLEYIYYWLKTDTYYVSGGDINYLPNFEVKSGKRLEDGRVKLEYSSDHMYGEVVLKPNGDSYFFVSNQYTGSVYDIDPFGGTNEKGFYAEGIKFLSGMIEKDSIAPWLEKKTDKDLAVFFEAYNGEKLQRIAPDKYDTYSPAVCRDIVFYRAEETEEPKELILNMIDAMIQPLTEPSADRPFTITAYKIMEQEVIPLKENIWILPVIDGYYSYEGMDLVLMEERLKEKSAQAVDGLVPFVRQGSSNTFIYILLKKDGVYRLQRADDMMKN